MEDEWPPTAGVTARVTKNSQQDRSTEMNRITMTRSGKDGLADGSKVGGRALRLSAVGALTAVVALAGLPAAATHPSSRHDKQPRIAFSRADDAIGGFALWTATPSGGDQQRLTPGAAYFPSWAPDRSHLLFDFPDENGGEQIGRMGADGSNFQQLTHLPGVSEAADYSPRAVSRSCSTGLLPKVTTSRSSPRSG